VVSERCRCSSMSYQTICDVDGTGRDKESVKSEYVVWSLSQGVLCGEKA